MSRRLEAQVQQLNSTTGRGTVRTHTVTIDRPVDKGGADQGPLGGELLLLSLAGCFLSNLLAAINARSAEVSNIRVSATGIIGGVPERFEAIDMRVTARFSDAELMRKLVGIAERGCLVTNTLRAALVITIATEQEA